MLEACDCLDTASSEGGFASLAPRTAFFATCLLLLELVVRAT